MARLIRLRRPEGGAEHGVSFTIAHGCKNAKAMRKALDSPSADEVTFAVGFFGAGLPSGVPFEVMSSNDCAVCGVTLRAWFEWQGSKLVASSLWTPDG